MNIDSGYSLQFIGGDDKNEYIHHGIICSNDMIDYIINIVDKGSFHDIDTFIHQICPSEDRNKKFVFDRESLLDVLLIILYNTNYNPGYVPYYKIDADYI